MRIEIVLLGVMGVILLITAGSSQTTTRKFVLSCQPLSQKANLNVRVEVEAGWGTSPAGCSGGGATISYAWDVVPNASFYFVNGTIVGNITRYQATSLEGFRVGPCVSGCACQPELFDTIAKSIPNPISVIARLNDGSNLDGTCAPEPFPTQFCGNLVLDPGEDCDDGNTLDHDGCPSTCQFAPSCDFSSTPGETERCYGGIGVGCDGVFALAPFIKNETTCEVTGWMSVGSILHDRCCIESNNTGYGCANGGFFTSRCRKEWDEAVNNTLGCPERLRQWQYPFGPYPAGNAGDCSSQDCLNLNLRAPSGARVNPKYQSLCQLGRCRVGENGKTIKEKDSCGWYCECE